MVEIYPKQETARQQRSVRLLTCIAWSAAVLGLAACIALCCMVNTLNAARYNFMVVGISTAAGWLVILLGRLGIAPTRAELLHAQGMQREPGEELHGRIVQEKLLFRIPHSVTVRKVQLQQENGKVAALNILARKSHLLPPDGTPVRVTAVRNYITAFEVEHE